MPYCMWAASACRTFSRVHDCPSVSTHPYGWVLQCLGLGTYASLATIQCAQSRAQLACPIAGIIGKSPPSRGALVIVPWLGVLSTVIEPPPPIVLQQLPMIPMHSEGDRPGRKEVGMWRHAIVIQHPLQYHRLNHWGGRL